MKKENMTENVNGTLTELVFILDRSGSMSGLEADTIGGFNGLVEKQKGQDGACLVTTVLFDYEITTLHDRTDLRVIPKMTEKDYAVRGSTALIDAIGTTIDHIANIHKYAREEDVPAHTMFVITTDGMENSSHVYTGAQVKKMIENKKKDGWEFLFIGANIDSVETAKSFGIEKERAVNYHADKKGTGVLFETVSKAVGCVRASKKLDASWSREIEEDFESRS